MSDVEAFESGYGNPFDWNLKEVSELLHEVRAGAKLKAALKTDWFWFQARSTNDSLSVLTMIVNRDRAKEVRHMMNNA